VNSWHRADADVDNAISGRKDAGDNRMLHHLTGRSRIASDDDRAWAGVCAEGLRETRQQ